jgi:hypothetical protein
MPSDGRAAAVPEFLGRVGDALPATDRKVIRNTAPRVNARIADETEAQVTRAARQPSRIDARLAALDREWDVERTLETNAALIGLAGIGLAALSGDRRLLWLPAAVSGFLLMHALQGWCPPLPLFRRMGVRTSAEINAERTAIKALRGDFAEIPTAGGSGAKSKARQAIDAAWR